MTVVGIHRSVGTTPPEPAVVQSVDVTAIGGLPGYLQAIGSFLLVVLFGGVILRRSEARVLRSLEALRERPYSAVPYGLVAYAVALAVGLYGFSQLGRVGVAGTFLGLLVALLLGGVFVSLTAFGFLVVGTLATDVHGRREPTYGLVVGAALSAIGWLLLPPAGGLAVWVLVAAFGLGGAVRLWVHAERTVETERAD
ncbi:hypothetical protein NDI56_17340 [Haloarcula sp. S1CR25-12]|uniref:Phosphate ABC transporter permease n=1 Tax=Haloarcula saliterrae TaxID=2950534 RepID=A0ABU2FFY1_9EURY|nr:hypothetical protein [Haloarcula sp. S1CR25-12]MDS0261167.1 hypothetical protein [Haloarcula sp. S1CR25-12]